MCGLSISLCLLGGEPKALLDVETNVDTTNSKTQTSGTGQTGKIRNKNGPIIIDNSTHTYNNVINIPLESLIDEESKKLIKNQFNQGNLQFVYQPSDSELIDFNKFEKESDQLNLAEYFYGKISNEDLQYLRTGLYIRMLSTKNKRRATMIKERAVAGNRRARNIINMASAGYFENYIKPIFENSSLEEATEEYENIVTFLPEFIFVNKTMGVDDIINGVQAKLDQKNKYHLRVQQIVINGLESCSDTIAMAEPKLAKQFPEYDLFIEKKKSGKLRQARLTISLS